MIYFENIIKILCIYITLLNKNNRKNMNMLSNKYKDLGLLKIFIAQVIAK